MTTNTFVSPERLAQFQSEFQFGSRVETPDGHRGIVNFFSHQLNMCRVFYDTPEHVTKAGEYKISECRLLSIEEAKSV